MKEDATACTVIVVKMHFGLETKVEEVSLCKVKNVTASSPLWRKDRDHKIKAHHRKFQYPPKVIISIVQLIPHGGKGGVKLR
jgi:hypothetical protein